MDPLMKDPRLPVVGLINDVRALRGVTHATATISDAGDRVTQLHVVAEAGVNAKALVRDIETLAIAKHRIPLDHRVVSVVAEAAPALAEAALAEAYQVRVKALELAVELRAGETTSAVLSCAERFERYLSGDPGTGTLAKGYMVSEGQEPEGGQP